MTTVVSTWLALILAAAAGLKAWRAEQAAEALATYGVSRPAIQRVSVWALISVELGLAGALVAGASVAAAGAAALFLAFALATSLALLAGRGGRPCACFTSASRLGWTSPIRALVLAGVAGVLALGWLGRGPSGYERWLTVAVSISLAAAAALALAVLALAREVGVLRMELGGRGALEIGEEGPELGAAQAWATAVPANPRAMMTLAIFTSDGCPLCRRVEPAVAHVAADPLLAVRIFDEVADAPIWAQAAVPGSPYAVALGLTGVALAKGTFNGLAQLESVVATARAREQGLAIAA
jgi:Methylamine utilisation protein MauE